MKTALITGATSGIGLAVAKQLAEQNWKLLLIGRTKEHCEEAASELKREFPNIDATAFTADLSLLSEVARVAQAVNFHIETYCSGELNVLVNNAGGVRSARTVTAEGLELQFALNYLSGFALAARLLPALKKANGCIISTGSDSHLFAKKLNWKNLMLQKGYNSLKAYAQSKLCVLLFSAEFNKRSQSGVKAYVVDPGLVKTGIGKKSTKGLTKLFWLIRMKGGKHPSVPAKTFLHIVNNRPNHMYLLKTNPAKQSKISKDAATAKKLFDLSEQLANVSFDF